MTKRVRRISCVFEKKKKGEELTKAGTGTRKPLPSGRTVTRGAARTSSSFGGTAIGGPCGTMIAGTGNSSSFSGTSSSHRTTTEGPYKTRTSSSSSGTAAVLGCNSETSSSTTCMGFALGTSSSSYITCVTNWSGETSLLRRRRRRHLDSLDGAMARV
jgi:hypothetical protein